jgi:hypothetical protein
VPPGIPDSAPVRFEARGSLKEPCGVSSPRHPGRAAAEIADEIRDFLIRNHLGRIAA